MTSEPTSEFDPALAREFDILLAAVERGHILTQDDLARANEIGAAALVAELDAAAATFTEIGAPAQSEGLELFPHLPNLSSERASN